MRWISVSKAVVPIVLAGVAARGIASEMPVVLVPPAASSVLVDAGLPPLSIGIDLVPPVHGRLVRQGTGFRYEPGQGFWGLGTDAFTFRSADDGIVTVLLVAGSYETVSVVDFEQDLPPPDRDGAWSWFDPERRLSPGRFVGGI